MFFKLNENFLLCDEQITGFLINTTRKRGGIMYCFDFQIYAHIGGRLL